MRGRATGCRPFPQSNLRKVESQPIFDTKTLCCLRGNRVVVPISSPKAKALAARYVSPIKTAAMSDSSRPASVVAGMETAIICSA